MNHLTVIEVAEPVATVCLSASPQAFKVERTREQGVFIQARFQEERGHEPFHLDRPSDPPELRNWYPAVSDGGQMDFAID